MSLTVVLLLLGGCAAGSALTRAAGDTEGMASPAPELIGTWRGGAIAMAGGPAQTTTSIDLTIEPDGTWAWSKRGAKQGGGRALVRGDRIVLEQANGGMIQLQRRGDTLWGVSSTFVPEAVSSVRLEKVAS